MRLGMRQSPASPCAPCSGVERSCGSRVLNSSPSLALACFLRPHVPTPPRPLPDSAHSPRRRSPPPAVPQCRSAQPHTRSDLRSGSQPRLVLHSPDNGRDPGAPDWASTVRTSRPPDASRRAQARSKDACALASVDQWPVARSRRGRVLTHEHARLAPLLDSAAVPS